jgi:hypothetical protein
MMRTVKWEDLVSPRAMWNFTLGDAWGALPTLLAMGGFFLLCVVIILIVKKLLTALLLGKEHNILWVRVGGSTKEHKDRWVDIERTGWGSFWHIVIETLVFFAFCVAILFCAAIGDINIWQSPISLTIFGAIFTFIFGPGLQQLGSGYFVFLFTKMRYGQYWEESGNPTVGGIIMQFDPLYVTFRVSYRNGDSGSIYRERIVPMTRILTSAWDRRPELEVDDNWKKEATCMACDPRYRANPEIV